MRHSLTENGLTALAVAGNHVVLLGWSMDEATLRQRGVLGFAIRRSRAADGEVIWLKGMKTFEATDPHPGPGVEVSSLKHPFQTFQWADYTVAPDNAYSYRIVAMTGAPAQLVPDAAVTLDLTTEPVDQGRHAVFFNRGAIASQAYARRFHNLPPDDVGQAAFDWLSRGLIEALEAFIGQAGAGDDIKGAIFEFQNHRVFAALTAAVGRGATVKVLYDADSEREANEAEIASAGIAYLTKARTRSGGFAHNKFFVLSRQGQPSQVWTGSTNLTKNGIFGHSNNAHIIRDPGIAKSYADYWALLDQDLTVKPTATAVVPLSPAPTVPAGDTAAVFSPRTNLDALDWYAALAAGAARGVFATFAFGMDQRFVTVYGHEDGVLRMALMEKKGNGVHYAEQAADIDRIRRLRNTVVAVGNYIAINSFDRWLKEIDKIDDKPHVRFIHTKYMLIDPLGDHPAVIVGSANFSKASTDKNDENMLVIRDNPAVADVYLGEFMRLYTHYAFRESLTFKHATDPASAQRRKYLVPDVGWIDGDGPTSGYFHVGGQRALRRLYFSGQ